MAQCFTCEDWLHQKCLSIALKDGVELFCRDCISGPFSFIKNSKYCCKNDEILDSKEVLINVSVLKLCNCESCQNNEKVKELSEFLTESALTAWYKRNPIDEEVEKSEDNVDINNLEFEQSRLFEGLTEQKKAHYLLMKSIFKDKFVDFLGKKRGRVVTESDVKEFIEELNN